MYNVILNGHCLHILGEESRLSIRLLDQYIRENRIAFATIPPALLDKDVLLDIDTLVVAGEVTNLETMISYREKGVKVLNAYGPTEDTVWSTCHSFETGDSNTNIGYPLQNTSLYILDRFLQPVPVGAPGELYIGGSGVARGYLNNGELTRERFIPNPFRSEQDRSEGYNDRLYRTGDMARFLPDGSVEYLGRNDFQVKIRGFRIEPGEIEARMSQFPGVKQSLVVVYEQGGVKHLAGYYVSSQPLEHEAFRSHLSSVLPDYMVPSVLIHLDHIPLTVNGKTDRRSLPAPELTGLSHYSAPSTEAEQELCRIYSTVLSVEADKLSVEDDFFRLGGNSILAIRLSGHVNRSFGTDMQISSIFTHRTIRGLAAFIESGPSRSVRIEGRPVSRAEDQLLSFAQERLWFIESYEEGSNAYNIPMLFRLEAGTDLPILCRSLESVIRRHDVLHSLVLTGSDGVGYQKVCDPDGMPVVFHDHTCPDVAAMETAMRSEMGRVFCLDREYPIRVSVYRCGGERYMCIVVHHIAFDGWSADLLVRELHTHYRHLQEGSLPDLPSVLQYRDFALWQRDYLQGEVLSRQMSFWHSHLDGYESLDLPTDYPRPSHVDYRGHDIRFTLDASTSSALRKKARDLGISLYSLCLGGYYLMLSAFSNQDDIVVGTPIAGRNYHEVQDTIGMFVNMLALRRRIDRRQGVDGFLRETGALVNRVHQYQDLPFEKLVDALRVGKDPSRHPVFQVMFGMQTFGSDLCGLDSLLRPYTLSGPGYESAKYDLTAMLDDSGECITGMFNYAVSLFRPETVHRYISVYRHILSQLSAAPCGQLLSHITYLDEAEYDRIVTGWNRTRCPYPADMTVIGMFEAQVARTPEHTAVVYGGVSLSYRELNRLANRLGSFLRHRHGIGPDDLVGLCLDRSEYMLASILGVLKSGGAYVPMDPHAPADRLCYMAGDTGSRVVLTDSRNYPALSVLFKAPVHAVDDAGFISRLEMDYDGENPDGCATPENLAYVIYTSGTTGNPKGVMIQNGSVVNRITWMNEKYPVTENDRILQKTTYTFDVSVWELFWANWYGACIVLAHHEDFKDNAYLCRLIGEQNVTVLHFVPSMLVAFAEGIEADDELRDHVQGLKYLFCSGEALNLYEVRKFHHLVPGCGVHNLYGPTEATVDVLYYDCTDKDISEVLIGKPISNTTAYVLNHELQPLPVGAAGELYIGGDGVGRGYLNNARLTGERFIPNPFRTEEEKSTGYNDRIYKTGDLVIRMDNGDIKYIGRNDFQVKIRGFRIELGEIEARMCEVDGIRQAVVLALDHQSGTKYLAGYYLSDTAVDDALILDHLVRNLPEYMIPSVFIHLQSLPVNSNGKLDRKALPEPRFGGQDIYVAPKNKTEQMLAGIFGDILGMDPSRISMEDDFFKLGGNSILAIRLSYRINEVFNLKLRLIDILDTKKVIGLAGIIERKIAGFNPVAKLNDAPNKDIMFMVHPGMGGCEIYIPVAQQIASHYQCYGIDSYNFYHEDKISDLSRLAGYYLPHILRTQPEPDKYNLFGWSLGGQIALEIAVQLERAGKKNITVYLLDTWVLEKEFVLIEGSDIDDIISRFKIPSIARDKVKSVIEMDNRISSQPLSDKLRYSNVVLFKAMRNNQHDHFCRYPKNNIDQQVASMHQLQVIEVDCGHMDIIEQPQVISEIISLSEHAG